MNCGTAEPAGQQHGLGRNALSLLWVSLLVPAAELLAERGCERHLEIMKTLGPEEEEPNGCTCSPRLPHPAQQSCPRPQNNLALGGSSPSRKGAQKALIDRRPPFTWQRGQAVGTAQSLEVYFCCCSVCSLVPELLRAFSAVQRGVAPLFLGHPLLSQSICCVLPN